LGPAKPGYVKLSDRSAAKKTDDAYQGQGCPLPMLNFVWTSHVCKWLLLFHCVSSGNSLKYALLPA